MDFFDEDDEYEREPVSTRAGGSGAGGGTPSRQQIRTRQLTFLGGAVVVFILMVLAVRGCLDARKERSYQNYISDLSSVTTDTDTVSKGFFDLLDGTQEASNDLTFQSEVSADRGTVQGLLDRAKGLDAPGDLDGAQQQVVLSYEMRRDALDAIASQTDNAFGDKDVAEKATKAITTQMGVLFASDVVYKRAQDQIESVLADEEITVEGGVPSSKFLPSGKKAPNYLEESTVASALARVGAGSASASASDCNDENTSHGLGIATVSVGGTPVEQGVPATVTASGAEVEVGVQDQGEAPESEIGVNVTLKGGGSDITGSQTISSIKPGATETVTIPLRPEPAAGESYDMTIEVDQVPCEGVSSNNKGQYSLTFG